MIVGLIGLGALGAVIAASLGTHADVRVLMRDSKAARRIASRGGIVVDDEPPVSVALSADASVLDGCHIVIVAVKTYSTIAALEPLRGTRVSQAPFVAFQNGIDSVAHIEYALRHHGGIALAPPRWVPCVRGSEVRGAWARA